MSFFKGYHFGLAKKTWEYKLKNFSSNCMKPDAWAAVGTPQRRAVISNVCEFLREAEKIANVHKDLKDQIINHVTIGKIFEVLPPKIIEKILDLGTGPDTKVDVKFQNIRTVLDKQLLHLQEYNLYQDGIKKSASSHNAFCPTGRGDGGRRYTPQNPPNKNPPNQGTPYKNPKNGKKQVRMPPVFFDGKEC